MNRKIEFIYPNKTQAVSLTGLKCALNCRHCGAHYLQFMKSIENLNLNDSKTSLLISGGCDKEGRVPIKENLDLLKKLKKQGFKLNLHTGLFDVRANGPRTTHCVRVRGEHSPLLDEIKDLADSVSFDFLVDDDTIKTVYGFDKTGEDYCDLLKAMLDKGLNVTPHITIGILGGKIKGEYEALRALKNLPCKEVVLLIFIPTKGTFYENCAPPPIAEVEKLFYYARKILKDKKITLGCLRPKGSYRYLTDITAIGNYFDKIVMPHINAVAYAKERYMEIVEKQECCVLS